MSTPVNVAVVYYSSTGTIATIAKAMAADAERAGAQVRLRRAAELAPQAAIDSNPAWAENARATADIPEVSPDDLVWADAVIFGTPTRFGNVTAQLKQFLDTLGGLWQSGQLADKVYSGFTSTATAHGGQESTLLALYNTIHHFGGILVTPGAHRPHEVRRRQPVRHLAHRRAGRPTGRRADAHRHPRTGRAGREVHPGHQGGPGRRKLTPAPSPPPADARPRARAPTPDGREKGFPPCRSTAVPTRNRTSPPTSGAGSP